VHNVLMHPK